MVIKSQAPCRISLFGGGSDLPVFYSKHGGMTISFAINLRQHFTFYTGEDIYSRGADEFPPGADPKFIYEIFRDYKLGGGHTIKIKSHCDAFLGSGLGTSAAAAIATIAAIARIKKFDLTSNELIESAWMSELFMGWYGGKQDQWASALGGANILTYNQNGDIKIQSILRGTAEEIAKGMVLFWTGERKKKNIQNNFKELNNQQIQALLDIKEMTLRAIPYLLKSDWQRIGKLMDIYWKQKKKSNPFVSNDKIDEIYKYALKAGALGGKLLGAGSGGYMLFLVDPGNRKSFIDDMFKHNQEAIDFGLDYQGVEARIL